MGREVPHLLNRVDEDVRGSFHPALRGQDYEEKLTGVRLVKPEEW